MMVDKAIGNVNTSYSRLLQLQAQVSSGKLVTKPSDDPHRAARAVQLRSVTSSIERYISNADEVAMWLSVTDSALDKATNMLQRARELAVRGVNGTLSADERKAVAIEIDQILEEMVQVANTRQSQRYLFGGNKTRLAPFEPLRDPATGSITSVQYHGDDGQLTVEVSVGITMEATISGQDAFAGGVNIFDALISTRDHLLSGDTQALSNVDLENLERGLEQITARRAEAGARLARVELIQQRLEQDKLSFTEHLSNTEDVDIVDAMVKLKEQEHVYQAALAVAARAVQPGLVYLLK